MLTNHQHLAKTSARPGKTQTINFFLINNTWNLVDLPGYGFAKVSKNQREQFEKMISDYLKYRPQMLCVFQLVDACIPPQKIDLEFINWLGEMRIPFSIIFTKSDKDKALAVQKNIKQFKAKMLENWTALPSMILTSAEKNRGSKEIMEFIKNAMSDAEN